MEVCVIDVEKNLSLMNEIDVNIQSLDNFEQDINKKESDILDLISKLKSKSFLDINDSLTNLVFQQNILSNEKKYSQNLRRIYLEKIYNEMYTLAESILMFVSSIDTIKFEEVGNDKLKIATIKNIPYDNLNIKNLFTLMTSINNNLSLIKNNLDEFEKYIDDTNKTIQDNNFHCKMFETNLLNQRQHIIIEYNKFSNQLTKILEYYNNFSKYISEQLNNQKIIEFCVSKKNLKTNENLFT